VSDFGKLIDPMADAIFHLTLFLVFLDLNLVPGWMVIVLVWREVAVSSLRLIASTDQQLVIAAARPGKIKANVQAVVGLLVMVAYLQEPEAALTHSIAFWGTLAAVVVSVYSGAFYFVGHRGTLASVYRRSKPSHLRRMRRPHLASPSPTRTANVGEEQGRVG